MARPRPPHGHGVRLAVTGTPGSGKTTLCALLAAQGRQVVGIEDLARQHDCIDGRDDTGAWLIDIERLRAAPLPPDLVVDGHLAHALDVDLVWVVRCDPRVLRKRLEGRGYPHAKVQENIEAEAIDLVLQEALAGAAPVVQRDATRRAPEALLRSFEAAGDGRGADAIEAVDWSDFLLE